jgi:hypothetical protein
MNSKGEKVWYVSEDIIIPNEICAERQKQPAISHSLVRKYRNPAVRQDNQS